MAKTKLAVRIAELCEQRDRLQEYAWDIQQTSDVRDSGPVLQAYSVILKELDSRIETFRPQQGDRPEHYRPSHEPIGAKDE